MKIDDIEEQAYIQGWVAARREERIVASLWFAALCFLLGVVIGYIL
jgi:hypothetical protein